MIPFRLDEGALAGMIDWFDLDVDASRVALRDGEPVGFGNLGLRGDEAWIGGVGVVTSARRQGIGELLMEALHDEAAARGVQARLARGDRAERRGVSAVREARLRPRPLGRGLDAPSRAAAGKRSRGSRGAGSCPHSRAADGARAVAALRRDARALRRCARARSRRRCGDLPSGRRSADCSDRR